MEQKSSAGQLNTDPSQYSELGYCARRCVVTGDELSQYQALLDRLVAGLGEGKRPEFLVEPHVTAPTWKEWLELCRKPEILDIVRGIFETDELLLLMTHLIVKPARDGKAVKWHQDNTYWTSVTGTDVTTVWLALDESSEINGCMKVIPNSHYGHQALEMHDTDGSSILDKELHIPPDLEAKALAIILEPGDLSLHDSFIVHGSDANSSEFRRAGYTMRYANALTVEVDVPRHHKPVYYVSGSGKGYKEGYRDIRPGKPLPDDPGEHTSRRHKQ